MRRKFLYLSFLLIFSSCQDKARPYITAFLLKNIEEDTFYYKEVYIYKEDGFAIIPEVKINDAILPITNFSYHWYLYSEDKEFVPERKYVMVITHDAGSATGEIFFPGDFRIIKPEENFILHKDSSLAIIWQKAKNGLNYFLSLYLVYSYIDQNGNTSSFTLSSDTLIVDTFLTYQKENLFPKNIGRINWGEGVLNIWAVDGSLILPGAKENIKGEGRGFYYGLNHSGERYFRIAQSGKRTLFPSPIIKERLKKRLCQR